MRTQIALAVLFLLGASSVSCMTWELCEDQKQGKATIKNVTLTPDPPAPGSTVEFSINGEAEESVEGGNLQITVNFMGFPIFTETRDMCDRTKCPIEAGPLNISYSEYLPPIAPPGSYIVQILAESYDHKPLMCLNVSFDIVPPPMPPAVKKVAGAVKEHVEAAMERARLVLASTEVERVVA